ncbi:cytochrome P450 [Georgenia thermotolerans]|uniref:cytochrome P450 n=1 Tax=Georgenia thermotolerans TaxID=527326 RepID=UPI001B8D6B77|nr:cytochrome P450 [Georgenia thermotolerans]
MPHWLFAFDAAGIATFRALALLAAHPETLAAVRREAGDLTAGPGPLTRATLLESLRLWPTTLTILRDSVEETTWAGRRAAPGTAFAVMSSFFHRDSTRLPWADRFTPEIWLDGRAAATEALVPFSAGPAACPGQTLVLDVAGTVLATLAAGGVALDPPDRLRSGDLPRTLAHTTLRFRLG